jgi:tRNA(adenine34) deaminase
MDQMDQREKDTRYMRRALEEARKAREEDEVPVGAVIVVNDQLIARGYNQTERLVDCTAHAEMIALTAAFNYMGSKYLPEATLYVTLEPCLMCAGALYWSRIGRILYGATDEKNGYSRTTGSVSPFHPRTLLEKGLLAAESAALMGDFFRGKRKG